jgi:hypothetical protein
MAAMYALFNDPLRDEEAIPLSGFHEFVDLGGGLVALKTWDGKFVRQEPNQRGVFTNVDKPNGPEECETFGGGVGVGVKTSWPRPKAVPPDKIYSYFCCQLPNC